MDTKNAKLEYNNVKIKYLETRQYYYDDPAINEFSLKLIILKWFKTKFNKKKNHLCSIGDYDIV